MSITNKLNQIKNAIYGKEVRGAIHDAIKQVYDDASVNHDNANMEVKMARGTHNTLNDRLDNVDEIQAQTNAQLSNLMIANVKDFGAKGDGVSDDTKPINDTITYALRNNLVIYIPYGIYKVLNLTINDANNFTIISNNGTLLLSEQATPYSNALLIQNSNNFTINGLNINGNINNIQGDLNKPLGTPQSSRNMQLINCSNFTIKNMYSYDRRLEAFSLEGCRNCELFNCRIINTDVGVIMSSKNAISCENITINNCYFEGGTSEGISLWHTTQNSLPNKNIIIKNCVFNGKSNDSHSIYIYNAEDITVLNNVFKNTLNASFGGIDIGNIYAKNIFVKGNLFEDIGEVSLINIQVNSSNVHILENTIKNSAKGRYINVKGEDIVIKNNSFYGFNVNNPNNLMLLSSCDRVLIEGNNFDGYTQNINDGIIIQETAKNVSIYRNTFPTSIRDSIVIPYNQTSDIINYEIVDNETNDISSNRTRTGDNIRYRGKMFKSTSNSYTVLDQFFSLPYAGSNYVELNITNALGSVLNPTKGVYPVDGTIITIKVVGGTLTIRPLSEKGAYRAKAQRNITTGETVSFIFANDMFNEI